MVRKVRAMVIDPGTRGIIVEVSPVRWCEEIAALINAEDIRPTNNLGGEMAMFYDEDAPNKSLSYNLAATLLVTLITGRRAHRLTGTIVFTGPIRNGRVTALPDHIEPGVTYIEFGKGDDSSPPSGGMR